MTFWIPISFFCFKNPHYKVKCLPGFLRCVICLVHFKPLRKIIPNYLKLLAFGIFWGTKRVTQWGFKPSSRKYIVLYIPQFIIIPFATTHSPKVSTYFCNFTTSFLFVIFLYIIQSSANSPIIESMFHQISRTL